MYSVLSPNPGPNLPDQSPIDKEIIVASFCSKCGAAIVPRRAVLHRMWHACCRGVAVQRPRQPVAAPAKSGSSALKIVLIVLAVFIGLGILGAGAFGYFVWRVAHAVHVSARATR